MNYQTHPILERLWPSRFVPADSKGRRLALLQVAIAMAIALAAGPEIILAMEMTTLLEMLGASLFLTAYAAGLRLTALALCRGLHRLLLPVSQVAVLRANVPSSAKAVAFLYVVANATGWVTGVFIVGAYGQHLLNPPIGM